MYDLWLEGELLLSLLKKLQENLPEDYEFEKYEDIFYERSHLQGIGRDEEEGTLTFTWDNHFSGGEDEPEYGLFFTVKESDLKFIETEIGV